MTLQEAKDQVARDYDYPDWWSIDFSNVSEEVLRDRVAALYAESKETKWISIKDRLPKPENVVMVTYKYPTGRQEVTMSFTTEKHPEFFDHVCYDLITHWMPLPEPPEL